MTSSQEPRLAPGLFLRNLPPPCMALFAAMVQGDQRQRRLVRARGSAFRRTACRPAIRRWRQGPRAASMANCSGAWHPHCNKEEL